jgi:hypothetical protein
MRATVQRLLILTTCLLMCTSRAHSEPDGPVRVEELQDTIATSIATAIRSYSNDETQLRKALLDFQWRVALTTRENRTFAEPHVLPEAAFQVAKTGAENGYAYIVTVTHPDLLYAVDQVTNTIRQVEVQVKYQLGGEAYLGIRFENSSSCVNTLSYFQVGGRPVLLEGLLSSKEYSASIVPSRPGILRQDGMAKNQVVFTRLEPGDVSVTLHVEYLRTHETQDITNQIPECGTPPRTRWPVVELLGGTGARLSAGFLQRSGSIGLLYSIRAEQLIIGGNYGGASNSPLIAGAAVAAGYVGQSTSFTVGGPLFYTSSKGRHLFGAGFELRGALRLSPLVDLVATAGISSIEQSGINAFALGGVAFNIGRPKTVVYDIPKAPDLPEEQGPRPVRDTTHLESPIQSSPVKTPEPSQPPHPEQFPVGDALVVLSAPGRPEIKATLTKADSQEYLRGLRAVELSGSRGYVALGTGSVWHGMSQNFEDRYRAATNHAHVLSVSLAPNGDWAFVTQFGEIVTNRESVNQIAINPNESARDVCLWSDWAIVLTDKSLYWDKTPESIKKQITKNQEISISRIRTDGTHVFLFDKEARLLDLSISDVRMATGLTIIPGVIVSVSFDGVNGSWVVVSR